MGHEMFIIVKGCVIFSESGTMFKTMAGGQHFGELASLLHRLLRTPTTAHVAAALALGLPFH